MGMAPRLRKGKLGGGDVVDVCGAEGGVDRAVGVGIIDHVQLGAAHLGIEWKTLLCCRTVLISSGPVTSPNVGS
jgi:hypothetical protein